MTENDALKVILKHSLVRHANNVFYPNFIKIYESSAFFLSIYSHWADAGYFFKHCQREIRKVSCNKNTYEIEG